MLKEIIIESHEKMQFIELTSKINNILKRSNINDGVCLVYTPHTTAGITINENADPDVVSDMIVQLNKIVPFRDNYNHLEGNSAAHIKSSIIGNSKNIIISNGKLLLGTWQGVYFTEFDGPRKRKVLIKLME